MDDMQRVECNDHESVDAACDSVRGKCCQDSLQSAGDAYGLIAGLGLREVSVGRVHGALPSRSWQ